MDTPRSPLSARNILSFIGANLTFASLLSWAANFIQVLTFTHGLLIFGIILVTSSVVFVVQLYNYQNVRISHLERELEQERRARNDLRQRLDKLVIEIRSRSAINPRPLIVNAYICTKRLEKASIGINVLEIKPSLIVIDKGSDDGLTYGMVFSVMTKSNNQHLEDCTVDRVEGKTAWLQHSGNSIGRHIQADDLRVHLLLPNDIHDFERDLAEMLLVAEGIDYS